MRNDYYEQLKSVRRGETIDDAYIEKLYGDVTSLYRLDQIGKKAGNPSSQKADLGKLPRMSVFLLSALGIAWVCIIFYVVFQAVKKKQSY